MQFVFVTLLIILPHSFFLNAIHCITAPAYFADLISQSTLQLEVAEAAVLAASGVGVGHAHQQNAYILFF